MSGRSGWPDPDEPDRLGDLLRATIGDGPVAPDDLVESTLTRVAGSRRADPRLRFGGIVALTAAITVVVAAAIGVALRPGPAAPAGPTSPSSASPAAADFPGEVLGLPTISVARALEIRDASPAGSEPLAVRGWYAGAPPVSCPFPGDIDALERTCPDFAEYLMDAPQETVVVRPDGFEVRTPAGPVLNPRFIGVAAPAGRRWPDVRPTQVVLVGHWHDPRSMLCSASAAARCRDAFVVDAVAWADGRALEPQVAETWSSTPPTSTAADVIAAVERARPGATILSLAVVARSRATDVDPRLLVVPAGDSANLWLVRVLGAGQPATTTAVYLRDGDPTVESMPAWPVMARTVDTVDLPAEVDGMPVISVMRALEMRDDPAQATEQRIAVRGWYTPWFPIPCPGPTVPLPPLIEGCPYDLAALAALPEVLHVENPDGSGSFEMPSGPALNPRFIASDPPDLGTAAGDWPVPVVFIGHFHDPTAASCPADLRDACGRAFVIDSLAWVGGAAAPTATPVATP